MKRKLISIESPAVEAGFLGKGHTARAVLNGNFKQSDPFILLMDDMLDKQDGEPAGGPHPHAGFETVSLLLEGEMGDSRHTLKGGDLQLMTAGSGIVHSETIVQKRKCAYFSCGSVFQKKTGGSRQEFRIYFLKALPFWKRVELRSGSIVVPLQE